MGLWLSPMVPFSVQSLLYHMPGSRLPLLQLKHMRGADHREDYVSQRKSNDCSWEINDRKN